jgi:hypothetical protein
MTLYNIVTSTEHWFMHKCKSVVKVTINVIVLLEPNVGIRIWNIRIFNAILEILKFSESNRSQGPYLLGSEIT